MNVELFPCSGGMAEGFRRAGIVFELAVDYSADACASYEANHGHKPVRMDVRDLVRMARQGFKPSAMIDLLVADPPCTPWSRAGKRQGRGDERDMLGETVELIELWRPRTYLIGNVPGLDDSTQWHNVQEVLMRLHRIGYCVADYAQLDAADYGVPQHRLRPFWFGHLDGPCIRWPSPTHCDPRELLNTHLPGIEPLRSWTTCREALGHLPIEELGRVARQTPNRKHPPIDPEAPSSTISTGGGRHQGNTLKLPRDRHPASLLDEPSHAIKTNTGRLGSGAALRTTRDRHPDATLDAPAPTIRGGGDGHSAPQVRLSRHEEPEHLSELDEPARTITTQCRAAGHATTLRLSQGMRVGSADRPSDTITAKASRVGAGSAHVLGWPWDSPSTTIMADDRIAPPGHHPESGSILSQPGVIVLSEQAAAILQGFPEGWRFVGATKKARWAQIGMAMPPGLAEAVACAISERR